MPQNNPKSSFYLQEWREYRRFTIDGLSKATGISVETLNLLERGEMEWDQDLVEKLAPMLQCTAGELIGFDPNKFAAILEIFEEMTTGEQREVLIELEAMRDERRKADGLSR